MDVILRASVSLLFGIASTAAAAQSAVEQPDRVAAEEPEGPTADKPARSRPSSRMIEEIIVTAQKREENLQDVPISVSAFSAGQLDARGIEDPKALQLATPGLQYNLVASYTIIYIRGVGTDAFIPSADASVATYIDGIYYPLGFGLAAALGSVERVEVLKGPQGTLFGRNTTGGAINIITQRPDPEFHTDLLLSRESYDKTNFRIFTNIPLADDLAISVSGLQYDEASYYDLSPRNPRSEQPREISRAFSVKGRWTPGDLDLTLGVKHATSTGSLGTSWPVDNVRPLGVALGVQHEPDYETGEDTPNYTDTTTTVVSADLLYSMPWLNMRFIGGDQNVKALGLIDYDGSTQPLLTFEGIGQYADVQTAELQFLSNAGSWGSDWLTWIGGLYFLKSSAGYDPLLFTVAPQLLQFAANPPGGLLGALDGLTAPLIDGLGAISDASGIPVADLLNNGVNLNLQGVLDTKSIAYFAQATASITDQLSLTLGGRFQDETRKLVKSTTGLALNPNDHDQVVPVFDFGPREKSFTNFSPKVSLDYKFGEQNLVYGSWTKGFKSGTYNIIAIYTPTQYVEPEEVTTIELGYKGTLLDGALRFNAAAFQNDIKNLQVQTISIASGGAVAFETAGGARIRGAEFDTVWELLPETLPGLVLTAAGCYLDGEYTDYENGGGFDETTGLSFGGSGLIVGGGVTPGRDFTGNRTVRTPEFSGNAGLSYTFGLGNGSFEMAGDVYYNSGAYFAAQNAESSKQASYHLYNARISYHYEPWDLRLTLFGKNLNDAKYYTIIQEVDLGTNKLLAPPSTYGVRLQWGF